VSSFKSVKIDEAGSGIIMVLLCTGVFSMIALGAIAIHNRMTASAMRERTLDRISGLAQSVQTLVSDPVICKDGVDGPTLPQPGLRFVDTGGAQVAFDPVAAAGTGGQLISFGTNFGTGANLVLQTQLAPLAISDFSLNLSKFYMTATLDATLANTYHGKMMARLSPIGVSTGPQLSDKLLANVLFEIDPVTASVVKCGADLTALTASSVCTALGCNLIDSRCKCPLPAATCPAGSYISGLDPVSLTPQCTPISIACGAGTFISGIDSSGVPVCASVQ